MNTSFMRNFFRRHSKKFLALVLCAVIAGAIPSQSYAITYGDITSTGIKDKENQISAAEEEKKKLEESLSNLEAIRDGLKKDKKNLTQYVKELDLQLEGLEQRVLELNNLIVAKELQIERAEEDLQAAILQEQTQYESMKLRIQFMYEQGETNYLAMLLNAESFSDMVNKADFIEQLSAYDRKKLDEYVELTEYVRLCKADLETQKELLDLAKENIVVEQNTIESLIVDKQKKIAELETNIASKEAMIAEYEEDLKFQDNLIKQWESEILNEKKEILLANGIKVSYSGEKLTWPCPSYTRISSEFGWRIHPTLGVNKFHNGVDMAAPKGTNILAAYSGEVVDATYNSSMGNYVLLNHGNGFYTIYMHASKLCVSPGDIVVEGEKIAEVGSTGRSTGPHLHFGVRKDGEYVNPMDYLNK